MAGKGILNKRALDVLNRASEVKRDIEFCDEDGGLQKEMRHFAEWLGDHLRSELQREAWADPEVVMDEDGVTLYLYSPAWSVGDDDHVSFSFNFPNLLFDPPCVQLYLPAEDVLAQRSVLLKQVRPQLKRNGFTDYYEKDDPDPSVPLWKYIDLAEFHGEGGFAIDSFTAAVVEGFRAFMDVEPLIDAAFRSMPDNPKPVPPERRLRTIAFLDTECEGTGKNRQMTELAIINVGYDADADEVVGILDEYCMEAGKALDAAKALRVLERADCIVAHNALVADRPLLVRYMPEAEKMQWRCSYREIDWAQLLEVQSDSLEVLLGKAGLRYEQDHHARADARDLKDLLALKHRGRTFLGRLLRRGGGLAAEA